MIRKKMSKMPLRELVFVLSSWLRDPNGIYIWIFAGF